jgi:DNA modification methylase
MNNIAIDKIFPYEKNAKKHPKKQIEQVAESIREFGFNQPIVVDKNNVIIVGHGRLEAAKLLDMKEVPVLMVDLTEEQASAYRLADNKLNESEWDMKLVIEELKGLSEPMLDLTGFGRDLILESDELDDNIPEEAPAMVQLGEIWKLGEHRLMCGDSTKLDDVEKLMDGKLADMIHTDPPYNVDYGSSKNPRHKIRSIENDKMNTGDWEKFCKDLFANFKLFNKGDVYMWGASGPEGMRMRLWLTEIGCHWSATIIWKKDRLVLTPANYQRMYEPCFYGWFDKSTWDGGRKEVEVWDMKRPTDSKLHPTMKPVEVCVRAITNSSRERDIVLDLFLGSGSTLIAAEKTKRVCYGMEIDPKYCDVIIKRYEEYSGKKAEKIG